MNVQKPWITSVNSVASYITFALDSRGRLMNLLINQSKIGRDGLHLNASGSPESNQKESFFKIENPGLRLVTTTLPEDNVLALLCVVLLFSFCLLFEGQCQQII